MSNMLHYDYSTNHISGFDLCCKIEINDICGFESMCGYLEEVETHVNTLSYKKLIVMHPLDREELLCKLPLPNPLIHQFHMCLLHHPLHKDLLLAMMYYPN